MNVIERSLETRIISRYFQPTLEEIERGAYISRQLFGPGKSGENSFRLVTEVRDIMLRHKMGEPVTEEEIGLAKQDSCSYPNPSDPQRCNKAPTGTVNYDWWGDETIITVCSREHGDLVEKGIQEELKAEGKFSSIARNGWGRA